MTIDEVRGLLERLSFIRTGGSDAELRAAEALRDRCAALGAKAWLEPFPVEMAEVESAVLTVDGVEIPCEGYRCAGSGDVEAELVYLPNTDPASLARVRGKLVLLDGFVTHFLYQDLYKAGALGFLTYTGNVHYADRDMDKKELRSYVSLGHKLPGVNLNAKDAFRLVQSRAQQAHLVLRQREWTGESRNVVAELPGSRDEWIVLTAHYDSTPLSRGAYDNLSGCLGQLCVLEALRDAPRTYGLRAVFCGSEERGLLGSKAYTAAHAEELDKLALVVNLDMIGSVMGRFIACVSGEEALVHYLRYLGAETGWGIAPRQGVYSSDSTPFADRGVPAVSFARSALPSQANIHTRYDTPELLSAEQILLDSAFVTEFVRRMACAAVCPVKREIPEKVRRELDEYLNRKRRES